LQNEANFSQFIQYLTNTNSQQLASKVIVLVSAANADFAVRTLAARATTPSDAGLGESALITKCHKPVWALTRILLGHGSEHPPPAGVCLFDFIVVDATT
jgi:hypothetical protein